MPGCAVALVRAGPLFLACLAPAGAVVSARSWFVFLAGVAAGCAVERGERLLGTVRGPWCAWLVGGRNRDQSVSVSTQGRAQLVPRRLGNPARGFSAVPTPVAGPLCVPCG